MRCNCDARGGPMCVEQVPIFNSLDSEEKLEIAGITEEKVFEKGEFIYAAGDHNHKLYVIHQGRVRISRLSDTGKEQVIRVAEPGDFFGELSLFSSLPNGTNAEAVETTVTCMIEGPKITDLMMKYPAIALKVIEELSQRLERAEQLIEDINLKSVERRIAQALLEFEQDDIVLNMTKGDFASQLGMTQETFSRKLSAFRDKKLIKLIGQRRIVILDREGLEDFV